MQGERNETKEASIPPEIARELWAARDMRWLHLFLALVLVLIAFALGRLVEHDRAQIAEREAAVSQQKFMDQFEAAWPCRGFDINQECNLRERRPTK